VGTYTPFIVCAAIFIPIFVSLRILHHIGEKRIDALKAKLAEHEVMLQASMNNVEQAIAIQYTIQTELPKLFPSLRSKISCPDCGRIYDLANMIQHLNDDHKWSREDIASWLETSGIDIKLRAESMGN
jgi:hypothetical protein